jgi:Methyltransferase domain
MLLAMIAVRDHDFQSTFGLTALKWRRFRHLTPTYIVDRLRLAAYQRLNPEAPWLTADAVGFLEDWLRPQHVGFEWGSGRSTVWFAARARHLTSVEDDPEWYREVAKRLQERGLAERVAYHHLPAGDERLRGSPPYVSAIAGHDSTLDFCLVDGVTRLRADCALACLPKLRPGGLLIIDNANWFIPRRGPSRAPNSRGLAEGYASDAWAELGRQIADWECVWTTNGVTDTALWVKPTQSNGHSAVDDS